MAGTVTAEQIAKLNCVIGTKATSLAFTVARLHSASDEDKKWVYTGLCGALCFIIDRQLGGVPVFRMYDLNYYTHLFEAQLYYEFDRHYTEINDNFYCFAIPGNHCIGFSFADSDEALQFKSLIRKYSPKHRTHDPLTDKLKQFIKADQKAAKKKPGFFKKLFGDKKQRTVEEVDPIDSYKISRPENPVHENHIGWDAKNQTFDLSQLSKELKRVFKKAGIRKKDLKDTNTALLIADALLNQPLPDLSPQRVKKPIEKVDEISENSRRSSMFGSQLKPIQIPSQVNGGDSMKKAGFQNSGTIAMSKQDEMSLTSKLASAMALRRKQLTKHDVESEEDDWSDDDF